jgi:VanZ family protein
MPINASPGHLASRLGLAIVVGILLLLFGFGSTPASANLVADPWDKLVHWSVFATLTIGLRVLLPRLPAPLIFAMTLAVAVADEMHQFLVPGRQPDWDDGLADMAGMVSGLFIRPWLERILVQAAPCHID